MDRRTSAPYVSGATPPPQQAAPHAGMGPYQRPNPGFQGQNPGFQGPNPGFQGPFQGFQPGQNAGYSMGQNGMPGFQGPYAAPNGMAGFQGPYAAPNGMAGFQGPYAVPNGMANFQGTAPNGMAGFQGNFQQNGMQGDSSFHACNAPQSGGGAAAYTPLITAPAPGLPIPAPPVGSIAPLSVGAAAVQYALFPGSLPLQTVLPGPDMMPSQPPPVSAPDMRQQAPETDPVQPEEEVFTGILIAKSPFGFLGEKKSALGISTEPEYWQSMPADDEKKIFLQHMQSGKFLTHQGLNDTPEAVDIVPANEEDTVTLWIGNDVLRQDLSFKKSSTPPLQLIAQQCSTGENGTPACACLPVMRLMSAKEHELQVCNDRKNRCSIS